LDWTLSPYVALYFAIEQQSTEDGAVWLFPSLSLNRMAEQKLGPWKELDDSDFQTEALKVLYPLEVSIHNERSASQQGVFTMCTHILSDHVAAIEETFHSQEEVYPLHKVIVPARLKEEFLFKLRVMIVTAGSLFPGLDGLGRPGRDYARLSAWLTQQKQEQR